MCKFLILERTEMSTAISNNFYFFLFFFLAKTMPKQNSTESTTTNFQDTGLVNSSNSNLKTNEVPSESGMKKKVKLKIDDDCDAIGNLIGHYGKWQFVMTILLSLFQVPNTFHIFSPTFQVRKSTKYRFLFFLSSL